MSHSKNIRVALGLATWLAAAAGANAGSVTHTISQGVRSASATFSTTAGSNILTIVLTNTSAYDVVQPDQVLTAVFFDWLPPPRYPDGFSPLTATVTAGSSIVNYVDPSLTNVGGEWAYRENAPATPLALGPGISSSGLGLFGPHDRFDTTNLQGPVNVAGLEFGLTSAGDDPSTGNTPVTGTRALIQNSVTFTLRADDDANFPNGSPFDLEANGFLSRIQNVRFQYGTSTNEPQFLVVPLPPAAWAGLGSLACVAVFAAIRRRRNAAV